MEELLDVVGTISCSPDILAQRKLLGPDLDRGVEELGKAPGVG